jgi:hypothetical protein
MSEIEVVANVKNISGLKKMGINRKKTGLGKKGIFFTGISLGLSLLIIYGLTLNALVDNPIRESVSKPFFIISFPVFKIGEAIFGQAPLFIFPILAFYWATLGIIIVSLVNQAIKRLNS